MDNRACERVSTGAVRCVPNFYICADSEGIMVPSKAGSYGRKAKISSYEPGDDGNSPRHENKHKPLRV